MKQWPFVQIAPLYFVGRFFNCFLRPRPLWQTKVQAAFLSAKIEATRPFFFLLPSYPCILTCVFLPFLPLLHEQIEATMAEQGASSLQYALVIDGKALSYALSTRLAPTFLKVGVYVYICVGVVGSNCFVASWGWCAHAFSGAGMCAVVFVL